MDAPRLTVALTIDHDAISDAVRRGDPPVKVSHAEFGPRVGIKRILALLASRAIPATFFVPGHTLTTFTDDTEAIVAGGHELACHGWFHEDFAELGADQAREVLGRSVEAVRAVTGAAPTGFRAPYWSLGHADARAGRGGRLRLRQLADGERLRPVPGPPRRSALDAGRDAVGHARARSSRCRSTGRWTTGRISSPVRAGRACRRRQPSSRSGPRSCAYAHEHAPGGLVMITVHPECIGRGHRMAMLERFIEAAVALDGVVFERLDAVVSRWAAAHP